MIRAVLWDFDGTLADTTEIIMRSFRHTMTMHLGEAPPDAEWLSGFGMTLETQIARFARTPGEERAMLDTYRTFQAECHDELFRPFAGAVATVAELAGRGIALAIVTSKHREGALRGMDLCGLVDHFPVIVTPEDVRHPKPHPEPVTRALVELGVDARDSLFVGDSPHDIAAGRDAGVRTVAAAWGPFPRRVLESAGPWRIAQQPEDVLALLADGGL